MEINVLEQYFQAYLDLDHHMVGVQLLESQADYELCQAEERKGRAFYCQLIKKATKSYRVKAALPNFSCDTSARILGLKEYYEEEEGIDGWYDSGLYANRILAEKQHQSVEPVTRPNYGVLVGSLDLIEVNPDLVLLACRPSQAMRLVQAYTYSYGFKKDIKISGQCGICFESTALPLKENDFSLSLLCSGTRFLSQWSDDTMMVSFPFGMIEKILDGLVATAQHVESNCDKAEIIQRLKQLGLNELGNLKESQAYYYKREEI